MHEAGASQRIIAEQLGISQSTVSRLFCEISIITFKTRGPRRAYKRSITDRTSRRIDRRSLKLRRVSLQDLINRLDLNLSKKTVALHLKHLGI